MKSRGRPLILLSVSLIISLSSATAQTFAPRRCEAPPVPVGSMRGAGDIAYALKSDGRPDTASVIVVATRGLSATAVRHAAVRVLERCRFDNNKLPQPRPARLAQTVFFDSSGAHLTYASDASSATLRALELAAPASVPALVEETNPLLEERPLRMECKSGGQVAPMTIPPGYSPGRGGPPSDSESMETYRMTLTVGADGRVVKGSVVSTGSTDPTSTNSVTRFMEGCRFAPGRIAGIPVAVSMKYEMSVRTRVEVIRTVERVRY